jgi:hypothetical protein
LPQECAVTRIGTLGCLIATTSITKITASNPAQVTAVRQLSEILEKAGMLSPIPDDLVHG